MLLGFLQKQLSVEKMLTENLGVNNLKDKLIKSVMRKFMDKFGLVSINEALAQICFEESNATHDYFFDELSEKYEDINKLIKCRHLITK